LAFVYLKHILKSTIMSMIISVHARQILDSRGNPTVEVDVETENGVVEELRFHLEPQLESTKLLN